MILPAGTPGVAFGDASDGDLRRDPDARRRWAGELDLAEGSWAWPQQVHGAVVHRVASPGALGPGDAMFTTTPGLGLVIGTADCFPVALVAPGAVGIAHAGWRGAAAGVVTALRQAMTESGTVPASAAIGPGIGPCCFEVGPEVAEQFPDDVATTTWGTTSVDLAGALARQLIGLDVRVVGECTFSGTGYRSHRRDGSPHRQVAVAWLPV